jgi:site-specific DNA recombinase
LQKNSYGVPVKPFIDAGMSGTTIDRPALKKLLDYCDNRKNNISAVICSTVGKLSRNFEDYIYLIEVLKKHGIEVLFVTEIGSTDTGLQKFMQSIDTAIAELYSYDIHERAKIGLANKQESKK